MRTERISDLSNRIFNTNLSEPRTQRTTNPFTETPSLSGSSIIKTENLVLADVFKKAEENSMSFRGRLSQSSKRIQSIFVGSINDFTQKFYEGIERIKAFGAKCKDCVVSGWNKLQEIGNTKVEFGKLDLGAIGDKFASMLNIREAQVSRMAKQPASVLSEQLAYHLGKLNSLSQVA